MAWSRKEDFLYKQGGLHFHVMCSECSTTSIPKDLKISIVSQTDLRWGPKAWDSCLETPLTPRFQDSACFVPFGVRVSHNPPGFAHEQVVRGGLRRLDAFKDRSALRCTRSRKWWKSWPGSLRRREGGGGGWGTESN